MPSSLGACKHVHLGVVTEVETAREARVLAGVVELAAERLDMEEAADGQVEPAGRRLGGRQGAAAQRSQRSEHRQAGYGPCHPQLALSFGAPGGIASGRRTCPLADSASRADALPLAAGATRRRVARWAKVAGRGDRGRAIGAAARGQCRARSGRWSHSPCSILPRYRCPVTEPPRPHGGQSQLLRHLQARRTIAPDLQRFLAIGTGTVELEARHLSLVSQCAPTARVASGGRFHPGSCRLIW